MPMPNDTSRARTSPIQLLPEHLINQIKAGEVVERPASLLKEILENSIDAGADQIKITIKNGGMDLIHISDNGKGMNKEDLPLAFDRHATSKISKFEDLYRLHSFGFRGEALASIASVSRITCHSSTGENGGTIELEGGKLLDLLPYQSGQRGTSIYVRDLFFNTPVRMNFIKGQSSEKNALKRMLHSFLLSYPQITFHVKWDEKETEIYPGGQQVDAFQRLHDICRRQKLQKDDFIFMDKEYEGHRITGLVAKKGLKGASSRQQFLFANNRMFFEKQFHQLIIRKMEGYWSKGESGHYVVFITVPEKYLDANVHPNKTQLKFFKQNLIYSLLQETIISQQSQAPLQTTTPPATPASQMPIDSIKIDEFLRDKTLGTGEIKRTRSDHGFKITKRFHIYQNDGHWYLVDCYRLCSQFLWEKAAHNKEIIPLLIGTPFCWSEGISESSAQALLEIGYEVEKVDNDTAIIRTVPKGVELLPYQYFVQAFLEGHTNSEKLTSSCIEHLKRDDYQFSDEAIAQMETTKAKYSQILNDRYLESLQEISLH